MAQAPEPPLEDHLWTIAIARLVFAPEMSIQAPPNLSPGALDRLLAAGIDDWGGVSPVTPDHVNPEAPWPQLDVLRRATEAAGKELVARLPIYPRFVQQPERWLAPEMRAPVLDRADAEGYAREDGWIAGAAAAPVPAAAPIAGRSVCRRSGWPGSCIERGTGSSSTRPTSCVCSRRAAARRRRSAATPTSCAPR